MPFGTSFLGGPLCIKCQILVKGGFLKEGRASRVGVPTLKVVVALCESGKGDLLANDTGSGSSGLGAAIKERDCSNKAFAANGASTGTVDCVIDVCATGCITSGASLGSCAPRNHIIS